MKEQLKLENQLCFPLYVCAKEVIRKYTPLLKPFDMTYTQYITMMAMWEHKSLTVNKMSKLLFLDSGTLTPMLKKMEKKNWIKRERSKDDERNVIIRITEEGESLQERLANVPNEMLQCLVIDKSDAQQLYLILNKILTKLK